MPPTGGVPLPFSESVRIGDTLFISGQIGNLPGALTLAPGGIAGDAAGAR
jgi:2-iminobutanoate/2-iminopropanoate deaminase